MFDCSPLGFLLFPKIIKIFIHKLWTHVCANNYILTTGSVLLLATEFHVQGCIGWRPLKSALLTEAWRGSGGFQLSKGSNEEEHRERTDITVGRQSHSLEVSDDDESTLEVVSSTAIVDPNESVQSLASVDSPRSFKAWIPLSFQNIILMTELV